jgi:hypothetical protein
MRSRGYGYAISIPFNQLKSSLFYVPSTHAVAQLFGEGEIFHGRTKAWKGFDVQLMEGFETSTNYDVRGHLQSDKEQDELVREFEKYKKQAIVLGSEPSN